MKILFVFFSFFFVVPHLVFAGLSINEIMYDLKTSSDNGREWVEIYNDSDVPVDVSSIRFFEGNTNHKVKLAPGGANIIAKGYAVIVSNVLNFKTDWPNFSGTIFDSSFSLNNSGETLMLKDKNLNIIDQYTYSSSVGAAGDGNSLQKINGVWQRATPTPGEENKIAYIPPSFPRTVPINKSEQASKINLTPKTNIPPSLPLLTQTLPKENNNPYFFPVTLILLLGASASAVYFIRQKKIVSSAGDDFKILDE